MAKGIVSDNSDFVLCSHRGLFPPEIVLDCLKKVKSLLLISTGGSDIRSLPLVSQRQYFSLLDDLTDLALRQFVRCQAEYTCKETK